MWIFSKPQLRVLVVCTANVCRSPAAEWLLNFHFRRLKLARKVQVVSAGTAVSISGQPPDPRMRALGRQFGVKVGGGGSTSATDLNLADFDVAWSMETQHLQALEQLPEAPKVSCELFHPDGSEVADPYYQSAAAVRETFELLESLARSRAEEIARKLA